ncbi:MAG: tetratricopeptide repeat protein [Bacteroidales bacterium]|nr:tetratricopeptide repeat protein [Bacteroidales bacterium]
MDILRKTVVILLLTVSYFGFGQTTEEIQTAFKESYSKETDGSYSEAVNIMKKVYKADSYPINLRLGWLTYLAGQYTESVSYYSKAIATKPLSIEARFGLTYPASAIGNWDQVLKQYQEILKMDPMNYTANLRLGQIYHSRKQYKEAEKYLTIVLNAFPFTYDPVLYSAWNNYYLGKTREAKVLFEIALMLSPGDSSATDGLKLIK